MAKQFPKHKLIFDEHLAPRTRFPRRNERFDAKHVDHDLHQGGSDDPAVYELAATLGRIIVTYNDRHFRPLVGTKADAGVIALPPHWPPHVIDTKLTALLLRHHPAYFAGHVISLGAPEAERRAA